MKFGYILQMNQRAVGDRHWWFKPLWKLGCPSKSSLFLWHILKNKVPTWDNLQKRNKQGLGWCTLCNFFEESTSHLFLSYPFSLRIWDIFLKAVGISMNWSGSSLLDAWKNWWSSTNGTHYRNIPPIICWGIWLAQNKIIFRTNLQITILLLFNVPLSMN